MKSINYIILALLFTFGCKNTQQFYDTIPYHDTFKIYSKQLGEFRVINIWTPPSYNNTNKSFPVLYMPDGGIKEDFPHIANTISKLIKDNNIPPIILVGIENTERGRDLTGFSEVKEDEKYCPITDGAIFFRNFITNELFEQINKKYRVTNKKGIIGESLAGLFVIETFLQNPEYFDFYIAFDPSLWWNNHYLTTNADALLLETLPKKEIKLWFAGSSAIDIAQHTKKLEESLKKNASDSLKWIYSDEPNEKHNTIFRAKKEKALKWSFSK